MTRTTRLSHKSCNHPPFAKMAIPELAALAHEAGYGDDDREYRSVVRAIAGRLHCQPGEIVFTNGTAVTL
jgi:hypothetical protein